MTVLLTILVRGGLPSGEFILGGWEADGGRAWSLLLFFVSPCFLSHDHASLSSAVASTRPAKRPTTLAQNQVLPWRNSSQRRMMGLF